MRYVKGPFGPYAENLRFVLRVMEGHLISGYADGGDAPNKELRLLPGAVRDAKVFLAAHASSHERFDRVARVVEGFETPFGLELLTTVHWVATQEEAREPDDMVKATYAWSERKRQFSPEQIKIAAERLQAEGWIAGSAI